MARTNELAHAMTHNVVTVGGNAAVGNAVIHGVFSANTIAVDVLKGFSGANVQLQSTELVVANTASMTTIGTVSVKGQMNIDSAGLLKISGANTTHRVLSVIDANGKVGFIQVEFPLDQLTDVDTSNVATKNGETIIKWNPVKSQWEANTLSVINSTHVNTLSVGTVTSVLTVANNVNLANNALFVNQATKRVGINTTSPDSALSVNGTILATGDITGWQSSDKNFKKNEVPMDETLALQLLDQIIMYEFDWDEEAVAKSEYVSSRARGRGVGTMAQELQQILPHLVHERPDGSLAVDYLGLMPYLWRAVGALKKKVG